MNGVIDLAGSRLARPVDRALEAVIRCGFSSVEVDLDRDLEALAREEAADPAASDLVGGDDPDVGAVLAPDLGEHRMNVRSLKEQARG